LKVSSGGSLCKPGCEIITGDKRHLLALGQYDGIDIITAREACEWLGLA
jgi:hypothetical protein